MALTAIKHLKIVVVYMYFSRKTERIEKRLLWLIHSKLSRGKKI